MQQPVQRSDRERVSQDMMQFTTEIVTAVIARQSVPKDEFAKFVGDIHRAMMDISFDDLSISGDLGIGMDVEEMDVELLPREEAPPAPAPTRGSSTSSIIQSLLYPSQTLFEPPVPHSVRVPPTAPPRLPSPPKTPVTAKAPRTAQAPVAPSAAPSPAPVEARTAPPPPTTAKKAKPVSKTVPAREPAAQAAVEPSAAKPLSPPPATRGKTRYGGPERRRNPIQSRKIFQPGLPKRLSSIEEALTNDYIVCLEDGRMVKDLEEYLRKKGMTPQQYREKWKLPPEYPMMAPNTLHKRGVVHEMDPVSGRIIRGI